MNIHQTVKISHFLLTKTYFGICVKILNISENGSSEFRDIHKKCVSTSLWVSMSVCYITLPDLTYPMIPPAATVSAYPKPIKSAMMILFWSPVCQVRPVFIIYSRRDNRIHVGWGRVIRSYNFCLLVRVRCICRYVWVMHTWPVLQVRTHYFEDKEVNNDNMNYKYKVDMCLLKMMFTQ